MRCADQDAIGRYPGLLRRQPFDLVAERRGEHARIHNHDRDGFSVRH